MLHRDVKPLNIIPTENGVLVLFIFGISKLLDSNEENIWRRNRGWIKRLTGERNRLIKFQNNRETSLKF